MNAVVCPVSLVRAARICLACVGVLATTALVANCFPGSTWLRGPAAEPSVDPALLVDRHLASARTDAERALERQVDELREFFRERRSRTREFAASVLSLSSKLSLVNGHMPWGDDQAHPRWVRAEFARIVFSDDDLTAAVRRAAAGYERSLRDIDGEMLVALRADVEQTLPSVDVEQLTSTALDDWTAALRQRSEQLVADAVVREAGAEVAVSVAGDLAAMAATEALVSAGILGVGGASAIETLGIGLVVAIVVDFAWTSLTDPVGRLADEIDRAIDALAARALDGDQERPGVRQTLAEFARRRQAERRAVLLQVLEGCALPVTGDRS